MDEEVRNLQQDGWAWGLVVVYLVGFGGIILVLLQVPRGPASEAESALSGA